MMTKCGIHFLAGFIDTKLTSGLSLVKQFIWDLIYINIDLH